MADFPNQDPRWPKDSHFEPEITEGKYKGCKRCQAWKSDRSDQCGNQPMIGFDKCRKHGAKGGRPITSGKKSKYIPKLTESIAKHLEDAELTSLRNEIAVLRGVQERAQDNLINAFDGKLDYKPFLAEWNEIAERLRVLTLAENKRQAQLASNINARQANALRAIILATVLDVVKDESIPRLQIPKVVGLKLIQKMS